MTMPPSGDHTHCALSSQLPIYIDDPSQHLPALQNSITFTGSKVLYTALTLVYESAENRFIDFPPILTTYLLRSAVRKRRSSARTSSSEYMDEWNMWMDGWNIWMDGIYR